jgi:hypothetical protein
MIHSALSVVRRKLSQGNVTKPDSLPELVLFQRSNHPRLSRLAIVLEVLATGEPEEWVGKLKQKITRQFLIDTLGFLA